MNGAADPALSQVKQWLLKRKPGLGEIDMDLDLIENRVIDSLSFLDFVFFLEELTGRELQASAETVSSFRTLRAIQEKVIDANAHG